jgi:hypothetical protein
MRSMGWTIRFPKGYQGGGSPQLESPEIRAESPTSGGFQQGATDMLWSVLGLDCRHDHEPGVVPDGFVVPG